MNGSFQMPPGMDMQAMFNTFMQTMMQQQNQQNMTVVQAVDKISNRKRDRDESSDSSEDEKPRKVLGNRKSNSKAKPIRNFETKKNEMLKEINNAIHAMTIFKEKAAQMETILGKINVDMDKTENMLKESAQELLNSTLDETMEQLEKGEIDGVLI